MFTPARSSAPDIGVSPESFSVSLTEGMEHTARLTVGNSGTADLTWSATTSTPWLAVSMWGTTSPGMALEFSVFFKTASLAPGVYEGAVNVASNDPDTPNVVVPVYLTIVSSESGETFDVALAPGWNLFSFPVHPDQTAPADVLSPIVGEYGIVYTYDGCDTADPWAQYDPDAPVYANDLTAMDETGGFWISAAAATTLPVAGTVPDTTSIPLCAGWNMVGYPALTAQSPADALASLAGGGCVTVYAYDPADAADPWKTYGSCTPAYVDDLTQMEPGRGYWIYVEQASTWSLP